MTVIREAGKEIIWTTEEGVEVTLDQMSAGHLLNTYRMLKRHQDALAQQLISYGVRRAGRLQYPADVRAAQIRYRDSLAMLRSEIERRHLQILL